MNNEKLSKFISLILRHHPETIGISLDEHGWADVSELLNGINNSGRQIDMPMLEEIVITNDKKRFSFNDDKTKIRANQGHSIAVDVELKEAKPPIKLYHGTAERFCDSIMEKGIVPNGRLYVHLSKDIDTAVKVGRRHGAPAVFEIAAGEMSENLFKFFLSENGVWLTKKVPPAYLKRLALTK